MASKRILRPFVYAVVHGTGLCGTPGCSEWCDVCLVLQTETRGKPFTYNLCATCRQALKDMVTLAHGEDGHGA